MAVKKNNNKKYKILFPVTTDSILKYYIKTSGMELSIAPGALRVDMLNSKGNLTPGCINIPYESLPGLIDDLTDVYNTYKTKLAL